MFKSRKKLNYYAIVIFALMLFSLRLLPTAFSQAEPERARSMGWSPDGTLFVIGYENGFVQIWDAATLRPISTYPVTPDLAWTQDTPMIVTSVAWSPVENKLAIGANIQDIAIVRIMDVTTGQILASFGAYWATEAVVWSPDGILVAGIATKYSGSTAEGWVKVWDITTEQEVAALYHGNYDASVSSIAWSPDGNRLASASDRWIRIWNTTTWDKLLTVEYSNYISSVAWNSDGSKLAVGNINGFVQVLDGTTGQPLVTLQGSSEQMHNVAWRPFEDQILGVGSKIIDIWDTNTGQVLQTIQCERPPYDAVWSPDGSRLLYGGTNLPVQVIDVPLTPITPTPTATDTPTPTPTDTPTVTPTPPVIFYDDFESGTSNWTYAAGWLRINTLSHSPTWAMQAVRTVTTPQSCDQLASSYAAESCRSLAFLKGINCCLLVKQPFRLSDNIIFV